MPFGSRAPSAQEVELAHQQDEARLFALASERLRREAEIWRPHEFFVTLSQDGAIPSVCPAVIDATGRERYLVSGALGRLPPGRWRASLILRLSAAAARRPLAVQFGADPHFESFSLPYGVPGLHRIDLEATVGDGDEPQIRLWLKRAAFHGEISFLGVGLSPC